MMARHLSGGGAAALISRRQMLARCSTGFGMLALSGLLADKAYAGLAKSVTAGTSPVGSPHFRPKAKSVIFCYMSGGVSHVDSFDPKPELARRHGQPMPVPVRPTVFNNNGNIMASPWEFRKYGQSGIPVSNMFPHIGSCADDIAVIRSMTSKVSEHAQGNYFFHCGQPFSGFPSAGAWINYGLGSESKNLPGFVVLSSGGIPHGGVSLFSSGFLPAVHQASLINPAANEPLRNIVPKEPDSLQRRRLGFIKQLDEIFLQRTKEDPQVEAAIRNCETAYQMQSSVPELVDLSGESEATKTLYGLDSPNKTTAEYARQCLLARRLIERGVRFIELTCLSVEIGAGGKANPWDQHGKIKDGHTAMALQVDQPIAGLIKDLKARGLLDQTLIIWSGEFGRTPFSQGSDGRDHNPYGFSSWLAGGGVKGGTIHGATDDLGYYAVENVATVYDLWATVLHLLGLDHERLTYRFGGRDFRLSDVHGHVIQPILA